MTLHKNTNTDGLKENIGIKAVSQPIQIDVLFIVPGLPNAYDPHDVRLSLYYEHREPFYH